MCSHQHTAHRRTDAPRKRSTLVRDVMRSAGAHSQPRAEEKQARRIVDSACTPPRGGRCTWHIAPTEAFARTGRC